MTVKKGDKVQHVLSGQSIVALSDEDGNGGTFSGRLWDVQAHALMGPMTFHVCEVKAVPTARGHAAPVSRPLRERR